MADAVWRGHEGQVKNIGFFAIWGVIMLAALAAAGMAQSGAAALLAFFIPVTVIFWRWLVTRFHRYELLEQRLVIQTGVINRRTNELELYRVKDIVALEPLLYRIFSRGRLRLETAETTTLHVVIDGISDVHKLRNTIRELVEKNRSRGKVLELVT